MTDTAVGDPLAAAAFTNRLRAAGEARYHHRHPFHLLMHSGRLTPHQLRQWVINRYYYQTRIPIKDALILSKSNDSEFRRMWIHRIVEQDGKGTDPGGLALWLRLAEGGRCSLYEPPPCRRRGTVSPSPSLPPLDAQRAADPASAETMGDQPLLLPDQDSHQRRADPLQIQ